MAPLARGSPKSSGRSPAPTTGKTICGTARARAPLAAASGQRGRGRGGASSGCRPVAGHRPVALEGQTLAEVRGLRPRSVESARDEDRRLRQAGARGGRPAADRPADEAARPLRRGGAQRVRRERRRGGAAHQGGAGRRRGRARLDRAGAGARGAAQGARDGRRPRLLVTRRRARRAPTSSPRAACSRRRSSASAPTSSSSASRPATPTAPCSGPPSPNACAGRCLAGRRARARGRQGARQAADRVRLRP